MLSKKLALVTGGSRGIGRGIALEINFVLSESEAKEVACSIDRMGRKALVVKAHVSKLDQVEAMRKEILDKFRDIDILVNNNVDLTWVVGCA